MCENQEKAQQDTFEHSQRQAEQIAEKAEERVKGKGVKSRACLQRGARASMATANMRTLGTEIPGNVASEGTTAGASREEDNETRRVKDGEA